MIPVTKRASNVGQGGLEQELVGMAFTQCTHRWRQAQQVIVHHMDMSRKKHGPMASANWSAWTLEECVVHGITS